MATQAQIGQIADIILKVFDSDPKVFEASLEAIKVNTERVTVQNQIEALRKQQREFNEQIEAQVQALLGQG